MVRGWTSVDDELPEKCGIYWVKGEIETIYGDKEDSPTLLYYMGNKYTKHEWQDVYSVGSRTGLNTEFYRGITHWADPVPPKEE